MQNSLRYLNLQYLYEIRMRVDKPIIVNYQGYYRYLGYYGLTDVKQNAIICLKDDIDKSIFHASANSVYSVEEEIKKGFLTASGGERIGVAGEYVFEKGQPLAIRNFTSICIRVPHIVVDCGVAIYNKCMSDKIHNVLIMSPPGLGKTTILRDLGKLISKKQSLNILICDERGEISIGDCGDTCDVLKFSNKATAFEAGIRAMRPDVIITDELLEEDISAIRKAVGAGIHVLASAHFAEFEHVSPPFTGLFDYYVLLDDNTVGKIKKIYNAMGAEI